ncbi:MAG TPA: glycine/sarcosine/betaine reductase selenoprotein B family protein [Thermoanaerobaculia bacterium]|nr:glycine/sarcosine/betaine reductase selenoprotein B family protein [Thermoanaerobaculia bacterium]
MAELADLPLSTRLFLKTYPWRRIDPVPWAEPRKSLAASNVALVSTAGLVLPTQPRFDDDIKGGDWSYREIPDDADVSTLIESHRSKSFDHSGLRTDANLGLPLDRLHELVRDGLIGSANRRHFSLMGSITAPGRLIAQSAPAVADALAADEVDAVLLIPI